MPSVECMGESFEVWPEISAWALADFAKVMASADKDAKGSSPETILAMMGLLEDYVVPDDWERFETVTRKKRATFEELMSIIKDVTEAQAERPTGRPSDSPDGSTVTALSSVPNSADKGLARYAGRPDLQVAILRQRGEVA